MQPLRALQRATFARVFIGSALVVVVVIIVGGILTPPNTPAAAATDDSATAVPAVVVPGIVPGGVVVTAPTVVTAVPLPLPLPPSPSPSPSYIIGPYNAPTGFFVSIDDPNPYRTAGCPDGNNLCLASGTRDDR